MGVQHDRSLRERRRRNRGGRRATDVEGASPLVLIVGSAQPAREACEAVLAKLHFAVAISETTEKALKVLPDLRPDIVVAPQEEFLEIRSQAPDNVHVLVMREEPELLLGAIRRALM
jgi:hypothetical protein